MTQGAPKTPRTTAAKKPNPLVKPAGSNADEELDMDMWLSNRGLVGKRRMRFGGEWFQFNKTATSANLTAHSEARKEGDLNRALAALLVDPDQADAFSAAFDRQLQPILEADQAAFIIGMLNFVLTGDTEATSGESSAS
jgi:hypothetical protein